MVVEGGSTKDGSCRPTGAGACAGGQAEPEEGGLPPE